VAFACPHPVWGEEVAAAVVLRDPVDEAELLRHCRQHLAEFACPKKLYILESIPKTGSGKIQRGVVAASVLAEESKAA
jgi:acyl-coenzyme A synthetase/AMP-(fatty) acid ligase